MTGERIAGGAQCDRLCTTSRQVDLLLAALSAQFAMQFPNEKQF